MNNHQSRFGYYHKARQIVRADKMNPAAAFMLTTGLILLVREDES